jgi:uncharacterized membrane protein YdbT with pleckstrin-like domain
MTEELKWEGRPSQLLNANVYIICALISVLILPVFYALWKWLEIRSQRYQLTTQRLRMSHGIFSRHTEEVELYRVKDTRLVEPFWLRMFSCANIVLYTSDRSTPTIILPAIKNGAQVRETLRSLVEQIRVKKGVREVDFE